jgi:uncharacterized membrane protein
MDNFLHYVPRWHVLAIHFPIALLIVAALIELVCIRRKVSPSRSSVIVACCGALGAIIAAALGWFLAVQMPHSEARELLQDHRWAGVTTAIVSTVAAIFGILALRRTGALRLWVFRILLWVSAIAVILAAHWGGELIYGEGYFSPKSETQVHAEHHHHHNEAEEHDEPSE